MAEFATEAEAAEEAEAVGSLLAALLTPLGAPLEEAVLLTPLATAEETPLETDDSTAPMVL